MFDGVPAEQFHQFIAARTSTLLPLHHHLSFPPPPNFDAFNHHHLSLPPNLLHHKDEPVLKQEVDNNNNSMNLPEINQSQTQKLHHQLNIDSSWTNDEVLALLKIRSTIDTCFPHLTWQHVSRKLGELGFKRSAEKCKEKFEEETRYFNNNNNNSYGFIISDLEQLYQLQPNPNPIPEAEVEVSKHDDVVLEKPKDDDGEQHKMLELEDAPVSTTRQCDEEMKSKDKRRKRRKNKFEMFKCMCEKMVNKMMDEQEQMQKKLLEDLLQRDRDKMEREEAWKKQETERMNRELEIMAKEQAIAGDRQATIIELLSKFSDGKYLKSSIPNSVASSPLNSSNNIEPNNSNQIIPCSSNPNSAKEEVGRRWPREEVVALINLRSSTSAVKNNEEEEEEKELGKSRGSVWELGYKRSGKRCKEKWENINKYLRKTKDNNVSKKRSLHSTTCPYFHQLTTLYTQPNHLLHHNTNAHPQLHHHNHIQYSPPPPPFSSS